MSIHSGHGYSGTNYDRFVERSDTSTFHKFKETFWTTKQAVIQKLGKKEDEHVVASDSELDAKLEVFKAIQKSCMELLRVIEKYQDRLCALSMEENATGRFLKSNSGQDKTRAGKMMAAVGKSQSFSAQQRLALRVPLVRLYQEVETFRYRAISDTLMTINRMESARTEYRGALLWMKDVSEQLDPDTFKQLEKFRKVQAQVKKTKAKFDKLKLDVMQKVDLLAASRCNMFSHVLANYQSSLLHFWEKTSRTMTAVSESFKGYQYYEFSVIKELQEPVQELTDSTKEATGVDLGDDFDPENEDSDESLDSCEDPIDTFVDDDDDNRLISLEESKSEDITPTAENTSLQNFFSDASDMQSRVGQESSKVENGRVEDKRTGDPADDLFLDFGEEAKELTENFDFSATKHPIPKKPIPKNVAKDLLSEELEPDDTDKDNMTILNEILNAPSAAGEDDFSREWQAVFGQNLSMSLTPGEGDQSHDISGFMPSSLLDMTQQMANLNTNSSGGLAGGAGSQPTGSTDPSKLGAKPKQKQKGQKTDMSAWFNLFADLDPLADPDSVGKQPDAGADPCMG